MGLAYTLAAVGIVPHSIYLSAYVHQVLGEPVSFATMVFGVYGLGVLLGGPLLDGQLTGRLGTWLALLVSTAVGLVAVAVVLVDRKCGLGRRIGRVAGHEPDGNRIDHGAPGA